MVAKITDAHHLLHTMTEDRRQHLLSLVCVMRRQEMERMAPSPAADLRLAASVQIERDIRDYLSLPAGYHLNMSRTSFGKPVLSAFPGLFFNISHSGSMILSVLGDRPAGADIQYLGGYNRRISRRTFAPEESEMLEKTRQLSGEAEAARLFTRIWTMKEAVLKAVGTGINLPLDSVTFEKCEDSSDRYHIIWDRKRAAAAMRDFTKEQREETEPLLSEPGIIITGAVRGQDARDYIYSVCGLGIHDFQLKPELVDL